MGIENPVHILFIALVALVVLGPKRLPEVARALGQGIREFRESINTHPDQQIVQQPPPGVSTGPAQAQVVYESIPAPPVVAGDAGPLVATQAAASGTEPQPATAIVTPASTPDGGQLAAASEPAAAPAPPEQGQPAGG